MKAKTSIGSRIFDTANMISLLLLAFVTLYPLYYVAIVSISHANSVLRGEIFLLPARINFESYKSVIRNASFYRSFINSVTYTILGTTINIVMSVMCAYPLSIKNYSGRKVFTIMIVITMFFSGGMIPNYLLIKALGMLDTIWAMVLPGAIGSWNMIIIRTYFQGLPESLRESAHIDGANDLVILFKIIIPLAMPVIATMALFYSVGHWNAFFNAMIYLTDKSRYPLQLILRNMLIENAVEEQFKSIMEDEGIISTTVKYAAVMISTLPILCVYPFVQKYFVKGVLVGSLKG